MLRMISVSGIALAMVIGFVVLSKQMRDDFEVRKKVYEGAVYMKHLAEAQLQCVKIESAQSAIVDVPAEGDSDESITAYQGSVSSNEATTDTLETDADLASKPEIFTAVSAETAGENTINVVATFKNVSGQSGKLRIKAGRKLGLKCLCEENKVVCNTAFSDINKKYVPGKLVKEKLPSN